MLNQEPFIINERTFTEFVKDGPNVGVVMIYTLSKFHEKYRLTAWASRELQLRGFKLEDLKYFDDQFANFYNSMLNQDDL